MRPCHYILGQSRRQNRTVQRSQRDGNCIPASANALFAAMRARRDCVRVNLRQQIRAGDGSRNGSACHDAPFPCCRCVTLAGSGVACAQSVYLYVAPGASVYVTPTPNGPTTTGRPRSIRDPILGHMRLSPRRFRRPIPRGRAGAYVARAPIYAPRYDAPLSALARRPASSCSGASMSRSRHGRQRRCRIAGGGGGRTLDAQSQGPSRPAWCRPFHLLPR